MPIDMNLALENRVRSATETFVKGKQNIAWALSQIQGINIERNRLREIIQETVQAFASSEVLKDQPIAVRGTELLNRLGLN